MFEIEALIELLLEKGMITKDELMGNIERSVFVRIAIRFAPSEARGVGIGRELMKFAIVAQWVRTGFSLSPT